MAVTAQEALGVSKRPLRVGRIRYGLWWLDQTTAGPRSRVRVVGDGAARVGRRVGRELRWAAELSLRSTVAGIEYARPEPWGDRKLFGLVTAIAVGALVVAVVLGMGMAQWAMTSSNTMFFAAAGAVAVGLTLLPLSYLVFVSRRGRAPSAETESSSEGTPHGEVPSEVVPVVVRPRVGDHLTGAPSGESVTARSPSASVTR
jgi:hypothetical protein